MKRKLWLSLVLILVSICSALFAHKICYAEWFWTHGQSGHPAEASSIFPDGLRITGLDESVWVHYAVPTVGEEGHKVRFIKSRYTLNNPVGWTNIESIHVYNGETKITEFNSGWPVIAPPVNETYEPTFDLGTAQAFDKGMGVSVKIFFGPNSGADSLMIHGVGADF